MRRLALRLAAVAFVAMLLPARFSMAGTSSKQLDAILPELRFDGVAFGDAIDFIRDVSAANININWKDLEGAGVSKDTPLNMRLRSIPLRKALDLMLAQAAAGTTLGFTLDQGVIEITTQEKIDSIMYTRVYPVQDLLMEIPDFNDAPNFDLNSSSNSSGQNGGQGNANGNNNNGGGGGGGGGGGLFNQSSSTSGAGEEKGKSRTERADDLMALIRDLIQPDVWVENGGKAAIRFYNGNLVVTAPRSVLEAIGGSFD